MLYPAKSDADMAAGTGAIQKKEENLLSFLSGCVSLLLILFAVFLLLFDSPLSDGNVEVLGLHIPFLVILALFAFGTLIILKAKCAFFSSTKGKPAIVLASIIGTCLFPWLFGYTLSALCIPFIAIGMVYASFRWYLRLCEYSHILLVSLISIAFACSIVATGFVATMELSAYEITIISSSLALFSWALLWTSKTELHDELMSVSSAESQKRATTVNADRWTYTTIGLDFGFTLGLICTQRYSLSQFSAANNILPAALFVVPIVFAGSVLLLFHEKHDYALERVSKDFLAFTMSIGILPLAITSILGKYICLMFLLLVSSIQIIIVINASIEFIRFEELNPAWYMGEEAFVCGGMTIGLACAIFGISGGWESSLFSFICIFILLFNIFAQTFINKGAYPTSDLFDREILMDATPPIAPNETPAYPQRATDLDQTRSRHPTKNRDAHGQGGSWRFKVAYICKRYDLSPRQVEIFELLAKGRDAKYIEETFCISKATTKTHIYNIYCRLDIHSKQELIDMVESVTPEEMRAGPNVEARP